mgnify:CR=1 FL=1
MPEPEVGEVLEKVSRLVGRGGRYVVYKCEDVYITNIEGIVAVYDAETDYAFIVDLPRVPGGSLDEKISNMLANYEYVLGCRARVVGEGILKGA